MTIKVIPMSLEETTKQSFSELNTHVIDKALFGARDKIIAVVSWADLAKSKLQRTYKGAVEFVTRYIAPEANYIVVTDFAEIMNKKAMKHPYDNAFRMEFYKPRQYPLFLQAERYSY